MSVLLFLFSGLGAKLLVSIEIDLVVESFVVGFPYFVIVLLLLFLLVVALCALLPF